MEGEIDLNKLISAKQISMLYRNFQKYINVELKAYDISSSEYSYLLILYENNYKLPQDDLTAISSLDRAAVTRSINTLVKKGYVTKTPSKNNSRRNIIELTQKAIDIEGKVFEVVYNWNNLMHQGIKKEELLTTINTLNKMVENIGG